MNYCETCGNELETKQEGLEWYCSRCEQSHYANPIPAIDAMLFDEEGRVLLGVRKQEPFKGKLNLPGGFMDMNETFEEGIARELREELGLQPKDYSEFTYAGSRVEYHIQQGKERQLLVVIMIGTIPHREFEPNSEVDKYVWKRPADIDPEELTSKYEYEHVQQAAVIAQARGIGT